MVWQRGSPAGEAQGVLRACRSRGGRGEKDPRPGKRTSVQMSRVSGKQTEKGRSGLPGGERRPGESPNASDGACSLGACRRVVGAMPEQQVVDAQAEPAPERRTVRYVRGTRSRQY